MKIEVGKKYKDGYGYTRLMRGGEPCLEDGKPKVYFMGTVVEPWKGSRLTEVGYDENGIALSFPNPIFNIVEELK